MLLHWIGPLGSVLTFCLTLYLLFQHGHFHLSLRPKPQSFEERKDLSLQQIRRSKRVIVAITGATGAILGIHLLRKLKSMNIETHLVISRWAVETIKFETDASVQSVRSLATHVYNASDAFAPISSGSFQVDAMIIVPCSMRTLSAVRSGYGDDLICRAADVMLKEQRKLVLAVRETPLSVIHLENMLELARQRVVIFPPVPAFYIKPNSVEDLVDQSVGRMIDALDLGESAEFPRWNGIKGSS